MTRTELENLLKTLDIQVFYNHTTQKDKVNLPYIVYLETGSSNMFGDNRTYYEIMNYSIILFNSKRDEVLETSIKTLLNNNKIPYEISDVRWNDDIMLWDTQFDVQI